MALNLSKALRIVCYLLAADGLSIIAVDFRGALDGNPILMFLGVSIIFFAIASAFYFFSRFKLVNQPFSYNPIRAGILWIAALIFGVIAVFLLYLILFSDSLFLDYSFFGRLIIFLYLAFCFSLLIRSVKLARHNWSAISRPYKIASILCILHAAFLSCSPWMQIGPNTDSFNKVFLFGVWPIMLLVWPFWVIPLWITCKRRCRRLFFPMGLGFLILTPALFYLWVMWAFTHYGPG